jgi:hypothetical protein
MAGRSPSDLPARRPAVVPKWQGSGFGLFCRGDAPHMTVLKEGRRGPKSEPLVRSFGKARTCAANGCDTQLSRYNPAPCCYLHQGWDREQRTRGRRRVAELPVALTTADDPPLD